MKSRTKSILVGLTLAIISVAPSVVDSADIEHQAGSLATDISIFPTEDANVWMAKATVTDIESGQILTQPQLRFKPGETAKLRSGGTMSADPNDGFDVYLEVFVGELGENVKYTSTVTIGGEVVSRQSANFKLK